jgi:uncharacterized protein with HEPN domain
MIPVTKTDHRKLIETLTDDDVEVHPDAMKFVHKIITGTGRNLLRAYESTKDVRKSVQAVFQQSESLKARALAEVRDILVNPVDRVRSVLVARKVPKESIDPIVRDLEQVLDLTASTAYEPVITQVPHDDPSVSLAFTAILELLMVELYDSAMDDGDFDDDHVTLENVMSGIAANEALASYVSI